MVFHFLRIDSSPLSLITRPLVSLCCVPVLLDTSHHASYDISTWMCQPLPGHGAFYSRASAAVPSLPSLLDELLRFNSVVTSSGKFSWILHPGCNECLPLPYPHDALCPNILWLLWNCNVIIDLYAIVPTYQSLPREVGAWSHSPLRL